MPRVPKPAPPAAELRAAYATAGFVPLARRYGVAPATIRTWLKAAGIEVRAKCRQPERRGRLTVAERNALRAAGLTIMPLAERAGVSWQAAERALRGEEMAGLVLAAIRAALL